MRITGNKGEWSELYALLKLLSLGKLYAADENINKVESVYFPIIQILRNPGRLDHVEFVLKGHGRYFFKWKFLKNNSSAMD